MSRLLQVRTGGAGLFVCATALLMVVTGCAGSDTAKSNQPAGTAKSNQTAGPPPAAAMTPLPFTFDGDATSVVVTDRGVYAADSGQDSHVTLSGSMYGNKGGRVLLVEAGANSQKEVATTAGAALSVAAAPDGTVYVVNVLPNDIKTEVVEFPNGSTTPGPLPFKFNGDFDHPSRVAVTAAGDVVVMSDEGIQVLPKDGQTPTLIKTDTASRFLAVDPKGAIFFSPGGLSDDEVDVIDKGSTEVRTFQKGDPASYKHQIVSMAFDTNGDRYTVFANCGPDQAEGDFGPCKTATYSLSKLANNSTTPTDVPLQGTLTSPLSVTVDKTGIYVADAQRVVKIAK